ncbi:hypothetical protein Lalb_Chr01g0010401 [Lupinus albus]|uniref:Uncharacterized protein n=1 Tax=Lupinus albus TaxID=3870 RepID=A0A6A4R603_LUPAL|nr:hypothetical protein Lalb_Chr01g0010401 [Lupinus albus]
MMHNFSHFLWKLKLWSYFSSLLNLCRYSMICTNRIGEMGSPCLKPLLAFRKSEGMPFIEYLQDTILTQTMAHLTNW